MCRPRRLPHAPATPGLVGGGPPWEGAGLSFPTLLAMGTDLYPPHPLSLSFSIHKMGTGRGLCDLGYTNSGLGWTLSGHTGQVSKTDLASPRAARGVLAVRQSTRTPVAGARPGERAGAAGGWQGGLGVSCQGGLARPPPGCLTLIGLPLLHTGRGWGGRRLAQTQAASSPACCGHCAQQASGSQTRAGLSLGLPSSWISVFMVT